MDKSFSCLDVTTNRKNFYWSTVFVLYIITYWILVILANVDMQTGGNTLYVHNDVLLYCWNFIDIDKLFQSCGTT